MRMPQFSKVNKHRKFNYTPMYYDAQKEELMERVEKAKQKYHSDESDESIARKERMKSGFQKNADINLSPGRKGAAMRTIIMISVIAFLCYYAFTHSDEIFALISK